MDRRFSNATSSLASAALKLCTELANYWRTVWPIRGVLIVPSCTICAALARSGARPTPVYAIRDEAVGFVLMPEWMATRILALLLGLSEVSPHTTL